MIIQLLLDVVAAWFLAPKAQNKSEQKWALVAVMPTAILGLSIVPLVLLRSRPIVEILVEQSIIWIIGVILSYSIIVYRKNAATRI